jgi:hypothetical protein
MCQVNNRTIRGIAEGISDGGHIVAAPHRGAKPLADLLGNPVAEDRNLLIELMVDPDDFFFDIGWRVVAAQKLCT